MKSSQNPEDEHKALSFLRQTSNNDDDKSKAPSPSGDEDFSMALNEASRRARAEGLFRRQPDDSRSFSDDETSRSTPHVGTAQRPTEEGPLWRRHSYPSSSINAFQPLSVRQGVKEKGQRNSGSTPQTWTVNQATRPLLLTFDAFGTLFTPKDPIEQQYSEVAFLYGFNIPPSSILSEFKKVFKKLNASHPNYGKSTNTPVRVWWSHVINDTLAPLLPPGSTLPPELVRDLYDRFASSAGYKLFPDIVPFLSTLGTSWSAATWPPKRTMLGIVSNSDPRVRSILSSFDIPILPSLFPPRYTPHSRRFHVDFGPATFAFATLSYEAGCSKPDKNIYSAAVGDAQAVMEQMAYVARLTRTGLSLLDEIRDDFHCMHVGDELDKDVIPAIEAGWDGVLLDRNAEEDVSFRNVELAPTKLSEKRTIVVPVINSLSALRQLVTKERFEDELGNPNQAPVYHDPKVAARDSLRDRSVRNRRYFKGRSVVPHPVSTSENMLYMLR